MRILEKAMKKGYAVPHFNVSNLESFQAVFSACNRLKSPAVIATSESAINYSSAEAIVSLFKVFAKNQGFELHLDHGKNIETVKKCINAGYTSVMIDASEKPFPENVRITKKAVYIAHKKGALVEAELGTIGGKEDYVKGKIKYTNAYQAKEFVELTNCDSLAVAIGTSHGAYKFPGKSHLNVFVLKDVKKMVKIPLVLHGASSVPEYIVKKANAYGAKIKNAHGVSEESIREAIKNGISKINIDTDLRIAFDAGIREFLKKNPSEFDYRKILSAGREEMEMIARRKIMLFGSAGRI